MSNIKKFRVEHGPSYSHIELSIDFDFTTKYGKKIYTMQDIIKDMVMFWQSGEGRLSDNDDNYTDAFLKQLCEECVIISAGLNLSTDGLIESFISREGWYPMDGKAGILITNFCIPNFNIPGDYDISEIS